MRFAIISDIHSNLEALQAVIKRIEQEKVERIVCLGDVIGYGASPNECCEIVRNKVDFCLLGNHDAALTGAMDEGMYYQAARHVLHWTREHITDENYKWLYSLPYTKVEGDLGFFHAAPLMPSGFFYVVHQSEAQTHSSFFDRLKPINFIGHSHLTAIFMLGHKRAKAVDEKQVGIKPDFRFIVNVGSVGQPRDKDPRACFAIWNSDTQTLQYIRVEYDIDTSAGKIISAGLDEKFAKRLFLGV